MQKSKNLSKMLVVGGMAIALLAPIAVSSTATNLIPNTIINVQAKSRRHHHRRYNRFQRKLIKFAKRARRRKIRKFKRALRHHHSKRERRHLRRMLRYLKRASAYRGAGQFFIFEA